MLLDDEISSLISEEKILPYDYQKRMKPKKKQGAQHEEHEMEFTGKNGHSFMIVLRKNRLDFNDFSVILRYKDDKTGIWYNLVRFNGKHTHTNNLERNTFSGFHIHTATQRYQEAGLRIENYAERTELYRTFEEAVVRFIERTNCRVERPKGTPELDIFGG